MNKRLKKKTHAADQMWFMKMLILMVFIIGMLVVGQRFNKQTNRVYWWPSPNEWSVKLGVTSKDPWALTQADLTRARLVYNVVTKPGYRILLLQGVMMMTGVATMLKGVEYAYLWQRKHMVRAIRLAREVSRRGVVVEIAGSVRIGAEQGVIYVSTVPVDQETSEGTYLFSVAWAPVRVVRV